MAVPARAQRTTPHDHGITQIRLPMEGNPLGYVNAWLLEDEDGYTLIDCGWKAADVTAALDEGLSDCGVPFGAIRRLLITHFHFDHYGCAGTLRTRGIPALYMHADDWDVVQQMYADPEARDAEADAWIARNGFSVESSREEDLQHHRTELATPTHLAADGERIGRLTAIWTPGHSPGHLCFLDARSGKIFTGDHILDPITSHVGMWYPTPEDRLGNYLDSLVKVREIGASGALPAHREPFPDVNGRIAQLFEHHAERELHILEALERAPASAAAIARSLPWTRRNLPFSELASLHQQFAVAETLAHLEHLRARGLVERDEAANPIVYSALRPSSAGSIAAVRSTSNSSSA